VARPLPALFAVAALAFLALAGTSSHTVRRGETLWQIAARHGTTVNALARANGIANPDLIFPGDVLTIPAGGTGASGGGTGASGGSSGQTYVVEKGDTLAAIARKFGTSVSKLVAANQLSNANFLLPRQRLVIPSGGSSASSGSSGSPSGGGGHHVVRSGETVAGIASRYGVSVKQLVDANGITGGRIYTGQRLLLSARPGSTSAASTSASAYTVKSGDTLGRIARKFGTSTGAIAKANNLANPNLLSIGTKLRIPGGGGGGGGGGGILCPVAGAHFMNDWGFPRTGGRFHEGNDLFAPRGTPFVAPVSGTVVRKVGKIGGNQVKLMGDNGVGYYGTHLDRFGKSGRVAAGEVIGYVGNTGNARGTATHLHFEIHPGGGAAVNPYPTVRAAC
jgi:LysM repeat protein